MTERRKFWRLQRFFMTLPVRCAGKSMETRTGEKYGNTNGKYQEKEGMPLAEAFLKDCGLSPEENARIVYLVGHHHTLEDIQGMDYQILIEADYIVNAEESHYSIENIRHFREQIFRTESGKTILDSIYPG